jgi:uncharacterized repeat protein (TIGR03803 family)
MAALALGGWLAVAMPAAAQIVLLHEFAGGSTDGSSPYGSLTLSGSTLYGTTYGGGRGLGTVFQINTDGSGFSLLHEFNGSDGAFPFGSLTLDGSTLYGMTLYGGSSGQGTIFKINTDGSDFSLLHEFSGTDGAYPYGSLTLDGSTLYGAAADGLTSFGTVFKINTDGSEFTLLHKFSGSDGANPYGSLTLSGSTLYGMTYVGGSSGYGTVFKMNTDGSRFSLLHEFNGSDGAFPFGSLTLSLDGSTLYGMTPYGYGGSYGLGTVFQINTDGSGFSLLHEFNGSDGAFPFGSLTLDGSTLYGMTLSGGSGNFGTVFSIAVPEPRVSPLLLAGVGAFGLLLRRVARR